MRSFYPPPCLTGICESKPIVLFKKGEESALAEPPDTAYHERLLKKGFALIDEDPYESMTCAPWESCKCKGRVVR
jgi:hypothetical protein